MSAFIEYHYLNYNEHPNRDPRKSRSGATLGGRRCEVLFPLIAMFNLVKSIGLL